MSGIINYDLATITMLSTSSKLCDDPSLARADGVLATALCDCLLRACVIVSQRAHLLLNMSCVTQVLLPWLLSLTWTNFELLLGLMWPLEWH